MGKGKGDEEHIHRFDTMLPGYPCVCGVKVHPDKGVLSGISHEQSLMVEIMMIRNINVELLEACEVALALYERLEEASGMKVGGKVKADWDLLKQAIAKATAKETEGK